MFNNENSQIFLDISFTDIFNSVQPQLDLLPLPSLYSTNSSFSNSLTPTLPPHTTSYEHISLPLCQLPKQLDPIQQYNITPLPLSFPQKKIVFDVKSHKFLTENETIYTFCPDQNDILTLLVASYTRPNWPEIAQILQKQCPFGSKWTAQQCYQHYNRVSRPDLVKGRWSGEEDRKLYIILTKFGSGKFGEVCKNMEGRSDNQIRYRIRKLWPQWWDL
ncbi:Myb-like DNA-binding domain-containing protein [Spironucleus salmonicida]|uniref:Myb-like DNA-binding domain-containing protein n=1 Tax=Spironucleus salmonicida TaxID=348837 RepID=V6LPS5_9EUKA|nr:Myb-like DNA-binding domain-containing protein [Spironucleus salmonicida]|eukprot:EST42754.1 Myb-like DNA-binding domain-containing protein [Spironucleus salmonicida]